MILTRGAPALILPSRWRNAPTGPLEIDDRNELARGLVLAVVGHDSTRGRGFIGARPMSYAGGQPSIDFSLPGAGGAMVAPIQRVATITQATVWWHGHWISHNISLGAQFVFLGGPGGSITPYCGAYMTNGSTGASRQLAASVNQSSSIYRYYAPQLDAPLSLDVAVSWAGPGDVRLYHDGALKTATTSVGTIPASLSGAESVVFNGAGPNNVAMNAGMAWINRALSADEVAELRLRPYQMLRTRPHRIISLMATAAAPAGVGVPVITQATDNAGDVTGSLASGDSTDDTTPTIIGTAPAGASVNVYRAGSISLGSAAADGAGDWSLTITLPVGSHSLTAVAQMGVELSEPSEPFLLTVVAAGAAPVITHYVDNVGALQGVFGSGTSTDDPVPVLYGTGVAGASLQVLRDGVASGAPVTVAGDGSWSFTPPGSLSAGTYTYRARQTVSGVTSADSAAFVLTVVAPSVAPDAPQILSYTDNFGPVVGVFLSGSSTDDTTPIFRGLGLPGALLRIMVDGALRRTLTVPESGAWFGAVTFFEPGSYTVTATQTQAGLESDESADFLVTILPPGVGVGSVGVLQPAGDAAPQLGSLKVFEPVLIRSEDNAGNTAQAYLVSTNAITESVPAWTAGTYDQGALVAHIGTVWQSLIEGNTTTPGVDALTWSAVRPVSGTGAFDGSPSTITAAPGSLLELQIHSRRSCNILALLRIVCQSATIEIIRSSVTVYSETRAAWGRTLPNRGFLPDDMVFVNLDIQPGDDMRLTLNAEAGRVYVGAMLIGKYVSLGTLQRGATSGVRDSSRIVEDEFGGVALTRRKSAKRMSGQSVIDASEADFAHAVLDQYRATPVCWVGVDSMHRSLIVLGYCRNFEIRYTDPTKYTLDFDVEGFA